jgi:hypothetical protein
VAKNRRVLTFREKKRGGNEIQRCLSKAVFPLQGRLSAADTVDEP